MKGLVKKIEMDSNRTERATRPVISPGKLFHLLFGQRATILRLSHIFTTKKIETPSGYLLTVFVNQ